MLGEHSNRRNIGFQETLFFSAPLLCSSSCSSTNLSLDFSFNDHTISNPLYYSCKYLNVIHGEWILILIGRVSTCVMMGCLLPGVATPLCPTLRTDMAALFISFAALFSGQRCVKSSYPLGFEVESELNVNQCSCKMTSFSIAILIFELSAFIHNEGDTKNMVERAMKACCQAWNIIDVVEYSDSEEAALITAADELLEKFNMKRKWLDRHFPMNDSADR